MTRVFLLWRIPDVIREESYAILLSVHATLESAERARAAITDAPEELDVDSYEVLP